MHSSIFDAASTFGECDMHPSDNFEESEKHSFQVEIEEGGFLIDF